MLQINVFRFTCSSNYHICCYGQSIGTPTPCLSMEWNYFKSAVKKISFRWWFIADKKIQEIQKAYFNIHQYYFSIISIQIWAFEGYGPLFKDSVFWRIDVGFLNKTLYNHQLGLVSHALHTVAFSSFNHIRDPDATL